MQLYELLSNLYPLFESSTCDQKVPCKVPVALLVTENSCYCKDLTSVRIFTDANTGSSGYAWSFIARFLSSASPSARSCKPTPVTNTDVPTCANG